MIRTIKTKKRIAVFFLGLLTAEMLTPGIASALTSGPTQPEMKQFAAAGTSDMVDLFTGDFKYNIPLLDVEGYPVNLNYASGAGMDDEASWVGLGWNLNVGAVNRGLRGIPDDASGDTVLTEAWTKPKITYGGRGTLRTEVFGNDVVKIGGSVTVGVFSDSYTGLGAEFGANAGVRLTMGGIMTAGLGVNAMSSTASGVDFGASLSLSGPDMANGTKVGPAHSAGIGYNSRQGLKELTLAQSLSQSAVPDNMSVSISYNTPPFYPKAMNNYKSSNATYSLDVGGMAFGVFGGAGVTGYKSVRQLAATTYRRPAFGMLYAARGKDNPNAFMDFLREKDNPVVKGMPNLAIPIATPDVFTYSGQAGSGQFRVYSGGSGVFFDPAAKDESDNTTLGGDIGFGAWVHGGVTFYDQDNDGKTGKWTSQNGFLANGDFRGENAGVGGEEAAYFKQGGEKNVGDPAFVRRIKDEEVVSVQLSKKSATGDFKVGNTVYTANSPYKKDGRQYRSSPIGYLTAKEAAAAGQEPDILNYPLNNYDDFSPVDCNKVAVQHISRVSDYRKPSHISEISVQAEDGRRMVYGLPVYNIKQEEYSFAVDPSKANTTTNRVTISESKPGEINHKAGLDEYYNKEVQPAYATSHLLTAVLSSDYSDLTGDGITADDAGTAVKFNYSKINAPFKWRTPYDQAMYNRALYADTTDDKGSFVYGEKELWYLHSIESKNMIAYFITDDRQDGLGVLNYMGGKNDAVKQRRLREIRLYAKSNLSVPIKTVVMEYGYTLCNGVPNSNAGGKLTLNKVYFKYASSGKGVHHPYVFEYKNTAGFGILQTDRWGTYKPSTANTANGWPDLKNDEFPYAVQNSDANEQVDMWQLTTVKLPTGGTLHVSYEADDYAYVQDRRSMGMTNILAMIKGDGAVTTNLNEAKGLRIKIPYGKTDGEATTWFVREYLDNEPQLYARLFLNISDLPESTDEQFYDFIPAYMLVDKVTISGSGTTNTYANVIFKDKREGNVTMNPMTLAAWQKMRQDYACYAYPGYRNRVQSDRPVQAALKQIVTAISNFRELRENFYERANRKGFAKNVKLSKSFARVVKWDGHKKGGGLRVKMIRMSDNWQEMSGESTDNSYGQVYEYNTTISPTDERVISSGVAAFEPSIGGDENALHLPVEYMEDIKGGLSNYFFLEKPFGESLYPAPQVGYSKVTVRRLNGSDAADPKNKTGVDVSEFFTARDYPVIVKSQPRPAVYNYQSNKSFLFFGANVVHEQVMSQGYTIILNDMHGKPRAERSLNMGGREIASTVYEYDSEPYNATSFRLRNRVKVVDEEGNIDPVEQVIGRELELYTDMREQETKNFGQTHAQGVDVIPGIFSFPLPIPHFPLMINKEYRLFRSASVLKTVQYSGVVKKVVKTIDGSTISAENVLYDRLTGQPVVTSTQNEFNDPVYTLNIPAYWIYKRMGGAYKNLNMLFQNFTTTNTANIPATYGAFLSPGDELVSVDNGEHFWVIGDEEGTTASLKMIDHTGKLEPYYLGTVKVYRSGYRNQLGASTASITSLRNPVGKDGRIVFFNNAQLEQYGVLEARATLFDDRWGMPGCIQQPCPDGYVMGEDGNCYIPPEVEIDAPGMCGADSKDYYNVRGAAFYATLSATSTNDTLRNAVWGGSAGGAGNGAAQGRFSAAGVVLCPSPKGTLPTGSTWDGYSRCFTVPDITSTYYLGMSSTANIRIYIDGVLVKERAQGLGAINYTRYHLYPITFTTAGQHTIAIETKTNGIAPGATQCAVEIYKASLSTLKTGTEQTVLNARIFTSYDMLQDIFNERKKTNVYVKNDAGTVLLRYLKCGTGAPSMCGMPNCGMVPGFDCAPGASQIPEQEKCVYYANKKTDAIYSIVRGSQVNDYGIYGTYFFDASNKLRDVKTNGFWGKCVAESTSSMAARTTAATDPEITYSSQAVQDTATGKSAARITAAAATTETFCGRLNNCGIWLGGDRAIHDGKWWSVKSCFYAPQSGMYYIGYAGDNNYRIKIDNGVIQEYLDPSNYSLVHWEVRPIYLNAGSHNIEIMALNFPGSLASVGVDIYNNTYAQLMSGTGLYLIFSTEHMVGTNARTAIYFTPDVPTNRFEWGASKVFSLCGLAPVYKVVAKGNVINPYLDGFLGNWRPVENKVVQTNRQDKNVFDEVTAKGLDIRNSGAYKKFTPFWYRALGKWTRDMTGIENNSDSLWVTSNYVTRYNAQGQEIENKNALGIFSSALYGFGQSLPKAVAANAQQREVFYENFDDRNFNRLCATTDVCDPDLFTLKEGSAGALVTGAAHSGNYAFELKGTMDLTTRVHNMQHKAGIYLSNNPLGEYFKKYIPELYSGGFSPMPYKRHIVSVWVKHSDLKSNDPGFLMTVYGVQLDFKRKATVEGWKLMEAEFTTNNQESLTLRLAKTLDGIILDDLRVFPFDAQMKSYTYDDKTMRLMAELDENNYATFYEYDDEGTLIRVKKETERGIMTIKESRSAYRKQ